ncbi:unnamed protein product [Arabidopsis halleri]
MAHRYSTSEKAKWVAGSLKVTRRSPVRIPDRDTTALASENKLTLIGRITNPKFQKAKAVVEYLPQYWNLENRVVGRELGSDLFQFRFETEADLQSVLGKSPYHFKQWMLILQRWAPIISASFPNTISFWVKIHKLPVLLWDDQTIRTIGRELGPVIGQDSAKARVRVEINGLLPLERSVPIRLPSGEVTMVDIEYEKLEKHCFHCFSLSHEKKSCPQLISPAKEASKPLGINQQLTLNRLDEKRRADQKKDSRPGSGDHRSGSNRGRSPRRSPPRRYSPPRRSPPRRVSPRRYPVPSRDSRDSRFSQSGNVQRFSETASRGQSHGRNQEDNHGRAFSNSRRDYNSRSSTHQRERETADREEFRSKSARMDRPHRESLGLPLPQASEGGNSSSHNRRPALERLSFGGEAGPSRFRQDVSIDSSKLQDVEIRYEAAANQGNNTTPAKVQELLGSPASGGSRTPVSLRLGPVPAVNKRKPPRAKAGFSKPATTTAPKTTQKAAGKRKVPRAPAKPRGARSPLQGASLRKVHSTRSKNPPKKRLCSESSKSVPCNEEAPGPSAPPAVMPSPALSSVRLATNPEVRDLIAKAWTGQPHDDDDVIAKLNRCRRDIIQWSKEQNQNSCNFIKETQISLDDALSSLIPNDDLITRLSATLDKAYKDEELFWRQRSRIQWLHSGDKNSAFFHAVTRGRRSVNSFSVIEDDSGAEFVEEEHITNVIASFYDSIFTSNGTSDFQVVEDTLSSSVSQEMNDHLTSLPDNLEIKAAGLGWAVGNGAHINLWYDPWLSLSHPISPCGPPSAASAGLTVQALLCPESNDWNVDAIRLLLPQYEVEIRSLITSSVPSTDSLVWLPEKSGSYSSKSGYAIAKKFSLPGEAEGFDWHKHIWSLKVAPKLKNFLWKSAAGALSVGSNLAKRGLQVEGCKRCGCFEDELHVLLNCEFAGEVWMLAPLTSQPNAPLITSPQLLLQCVCRIVSLPPSRVALTPLAPWLMWNLWIARNLLLFENRVFSAKEVVHKAVKDARQWQDAQFDIPTPSPRVPAPPEHFMCDTAYVCYVDAAWCATTRLSGAGWILKSPDGLILSQASSTRPFVSSALVAEALAIRSALLHITSIAHFSYNRSLMICSDSQVLIKLLKSNGSFKELKGILHDISCLKDLFSSISFVFISRLNNLEADSLAKSALSTSRFVNISSPVERIF